MKYQVFINDLISPEAISARYVEWQLSEAIADGADEIAVYINSLGGSVAEALKIRQLLRDCELPTTAYIFGLTASAATIIATGCQRVEISRFALMLVHCSSVQLLQYDTVRSEDLERLADELHTEAANLSKVDDLIANIYAHFASRQASDFLELMKQERWLTAEEARQEGLVHDLIAEEDDYHTANPADLAPARIAAVANLGMPSPLSEESPELPESPESPESPENSPAEPAEMPLLDAAIAENAAEIARLREENARMRAQLEALRKAPAADTLNIEASDPADEPLTPAARARKTLDTLRAIL